MDSFVALVLGRKLDLRRRPPQSKLSSPGLTGRSSTPRLLDSIASVSGILGRPVKPGDDSGVCFVHQGRPQGRHGTRNDVDRHEFAFPRREAPGVLRIVPPSQNRGRRESRVRAAPRSRVQLLLGKNAHEHTGSAEAIRPSLRSGFTAYSALSPVTGLLDTVIRWKFCFPRT